MEKIKQGWNYGTTKRATKKENEQTEQKKGMTVREHMTQYVLRTINIVENRLKSVVDHILMFVLIEFKTNERSRMVSACHAACADCNICPCIF